MHEKPGRPCWVWKILIDITFGVSEYFLCRLWLLQHPIQKVFRVLSSYCTCLMTCGVTIATQLSVTNGWNLPRGYAIELLWSSV